MQSIFDAITEWIKELLIGAIEGNLSNMFGDVNDKVGTIAAEVGTTPQAWNSNIFSMIQTLSETVIIPIAGIIITYVLCVELIGMVTERNNLHDIDTFMFFKWFFKAWVAVFIVTHTFDITMAAFDVGQHIVSGAAGVIGGNTSIDVDATLAAMRSGLEAMEIPELLLLTVETMLIGLCMKIMAVLITVIVYGRMIEIYLYCSVAPVPFATMTNREWDKSEQLPERPVCAGISGIFHHGMCRHLRGACQRYDNRGQHTQRDFFYRRIYRHSLFQLVQDRLTG